MLQALRYLLWALAPESPVFIYTHVHLFRPESWRECSTVKFARPGWRDVLDGHRANLVVVEAEMYPELCALLHEDPDWLTLLDETGSGSRDETGDPGADDDALLLGTDDGQVFRFPPEQSDRLRLAYACSVHRGQGIELPLSVIVAHPAAGAFFLRREMLYTAVTRAKLATVIVGTREVVARAARTPDTGRRHSRLAERLTRRPVASR